MAVRTIIDGATFKEMLVAGTNWLEKIVPDIDALNVYPVPDGDTGTNMLLTMRACLEGIETCSNGSVSSVVCAMEKGALMGARGNSGVILSQIIHGLARELQGEDIADAECLARALQCGADAAYMALSDPKEGTILTVMNDAASAAIKAANASGATATSVLAAATNAARASVMNTPNLLRVLKENGVVDAGGHGLFTILEGALLYIKDKTNGKLPELLSRQKPLITGATEISHEDDYYGFCTQFMIKGQNLDAKKIRSALDNLGQSLIVVGDSSLIRVHIHSHDTETVVNRASSFGMIEDSDIRSMDAQHQDFLLVKRGSTMQTAVIAVANGDGLINTFADLGAAAIVPGGQTMNPSTMDILNTIERVDSDSIIILPNNKNVITTARLVQPLTGKKVNVIPTETVPQGIAAMIDFVPEADYETNSSQMAQNFDCVKTIEVTHSARDTSTNGMDIKQGQFVALVDNQLKVSGQNPSDAIFKALSKIDMDECRVVTLYYGKDAEREEALAITSSITNVYPNISAGCVSGGQPEFLYILSVE
ncbi:MAG: DAK2 domain-containing protein [Dehalococcoidales bacterium]|nr:DAK2 domain-containing protein [Dehalococcoidales bacterium]MDD4323034.1 DAK2 domain-containing protein [Dehalococcoidales bacterium]MDD4794007.1 DAK2 domain-containing protein [Dehalococcoidales bacterium]